MFLLIYVLDSVSFVMFVCLSLYSLLPDLCLESGSPTLQTPDKIFCQIKETTGRPI